MNCEDFLDILSSIDSDKIRSELRDYLLMEKRYDVEKLRKIGFLNIEEALYFFVVAFLRFQANISQELEIYSNE